MEKMPILKRIIYIIINFFKMMFLYIVNFILYLFGRDNESIREHIIVVTKDIKHNKVELRDSDYSVPIDPSSLVSDPGNAPDEVLKRKEHIIYKHISNQYDGNIRMYIVTLEMINTIIDDYIEKKEEIELKDLDKEKNKIYELWKEEIIVPKIKKELERMYIDNEDKLKKSITIIIDKELELEKKKVNEVKEVIKESNEVVKSIVINKKEDIIIDFHNELNETAIEVNEQVFTSNKKIESKPIELKDEVVDILESSFLVLENVEKEVLSNSFKNDVIEEKKDDTLDVTLSNDKEFDNDVIVDDKEEVIKDSNVLLEDDVIEEIKDKNNVEEIKKIIEIKEEKKKLEEQRIELIQEQEVILEHVKLPKTDVNEDNIIDKVKNERYKEDIEDRDYDSLEAMVNQALEKIDNFIIMNEKKLTNQQLIQLEKQKERLQLTKEKIKQQREFDIETERKELEANIQQREINGLQQHLLNMHLENQIDLTNNLINRIEDLEYMSGAKARQIEKLLIKQKLRKACNSVAYPSLFMLPFIRNKYFLFFSGGLIVHKHLSFIGDVFRRQTTPYQEEDLTNLITGRESLNEALNITVNNINYLNAIESEAMRRYPELMFDSEYLHHINRLKRDLNNNYKRLNRRHDTIEKIIYKTNKHIKVLKNNNKKKKVNNAA